MFSDACIVYMIERKSLRIWEHIELKYLKTCSLSLANVDSHCHIPLKMLRLLYPPPPMDLSQKKELAGYAEETLPALTRGALNLPAQ
jgi:hypothetical protein